jgi:asparagine synthase (glutamine-hydrolysing)
MLDTLSYGHYQATNAYTDQSIAVGWASPDKADRRTTGLWYEGEAAVVLVRGYVLPGPGNDRRLETGTQAGEAHNWHPAHQVYDLYVRLGPACIEQLDGAFLVAIWDKEQQHLVLGTDKFGLQPLYYIEQDDGLVFASELKGLLQVPCVARELNLEALADFFSFSYILGDKTFVQGVQLLSPASILIYQDNKWSVASYWHLPYPDSYPSRPDAWYDELIYDAIAGAIDGMLEPDRRYGVALSGGLDTRWIASLLSQRRPDTMTMTFGIEGCDDVQFAARVAQQIGVEHIWIPLTPDAIVQQWDKAAYITDGAFNVLEANEFPLSQAQPSYVDISVGGFLGGQTFGYNLVDPQTIRLTKRSVLPYLYKRSRRRSLPDEDLAHVFGHETYSKLKQAAHQSLQDSLAGAPSDVPANIIDYFDFRHWERRFNFPGQLLKQAYIEARYPFCHRQIVNAALQLPPAQRRVERAYRRSFAKHFPSLDTIPWAATLLPPSSSLTVIAAHHALREIAERLPDTWLPYQIAGLRLKKRRYADYNKWFQGRLGQHVKSVLLGPDSNPLGLFNSAYLSELIEAQISGHRNVRNFIGLLLTFELWSRTFLGLSPPPDFADAL